MTGSTHMSDARANRWRIAGWGLVAFLLLVPAAAMQLTSEVSWGPGDFVAAAALLGLTGTGLELAARLPGSAVRRLAVAGGIVVLALLVWIERAVGIF